MSFPTPTVVNGGLSMIVAALNGTAVSFTKVKVGNGAAPATADAIAELTDIVNPIYTCDITDYTTSENSVTVTFTFTNQNVESEFTWSEIGLYASCNGEESLFAYTNAGDSPETVPANDSSFYEENNYSLTIVVDSTENLSATVRSQSFASRADLDDHIYNYNNPHRVTAEQVGLGSVPNVTTNNQTPTFSEAANLVKLTSGQKLSTILGKIAKAVSSLISHLADYSNPHQVTASQIGAAASSHAHSASAITSGTLSPTRGGTGKSAWNEGELIYASGETALGQVTRPSGTSFLVQGSSGAPYFLSMAVAMSAASSSSDDGTDLSGFYTKGQTLTAETSALFGITPALPEGVFATLAQLIYGTGGQYRWSRSKTTSTTSISATGTTDVFWIEAQYTNKASAAPDSMTIYYGSTPEAAQARTDSVTISMTSSSITFRGITYGSAALDDAIAAISNALVGKYVYATGAVFNASAKNGTYNVSNETVKTAWGLVTEVGRQYNSRMYFEIAEWAEVTTYNTDQEIVTSSDPNAYPIAGDGWTYTALGQIAEKIPLVEYGSYTGDGTYGAGNPRTISVNFQPRMFFITAGSAEAKAIRPQTSTLVRLGTSQNTLTLTWGDRNVSFYGTTAANQLNTNGTVYNYAIFG